MTFQSLLKDAYDIAIYICAHFQDRCTFPLPHSPAFHNSLNHAVMHYLASWMQSDTHPKTSIYRYAQERYPNAENLDYIQRQLYWNRNQMLKYRDTPAPAKHDDADLFAIMNRTQHKGSLMDLASRGHIHNANYVSNARLAKAYQSYDDDYTAAAKLTDDADYLIRSIHFYRVEQSFAFSLIAQVAQYMKDHSLDSFDPSIAQAFWCEAKVENMSDEISEHSNFCAPPDVRLYHKHIPIVLSGAMQSDYQMLLQQERACRTLEQNVFERLPLPTGTETFDKAEIADFLRCHYPLPENHTSVSFYQNEKPDYQKLKLLRYVFKQLYPTTLP